MGFFRDLVDRLRGGGGRPQPTPPPASLEEDSPEAAPSRPVADLPVEVPQPDPEVADDPPALVLDLGLGEFAPVLDELAPSETADERTDRIPSGEDPRTQRIEAEIVALGLLSSEQIAEARRVQAEIDRSRPRSASPAEAAEARRVRRERVAERRQRDIIYLGRGVSSRLGDHTGNPQALEARGLPPIATAAELADSLGISIPRLRWLAFHSEAATRVHYVTFEVPKRSGGTRVLATPHRSLAEAQRWIFERIVTLLPVEPEAHGFVRGRGILSNASPHAQRALVINLDLRDFFPSITFPRIRSVFQRAGYSPAVATILALLCTECPRKRVTLNKQTYHVATGPRALPQGASTSPGLSNQVARRLDRRLAGLATKLGATYTRYADDLTFSGTIELETRVGYLLARVRHLAEAEGFAVNEAKTRVLRQNSAQMVTGLVVNDRPGVPRLEVRRLRAILHRARSEGLTSQNRQGHPDFTSHLRGRIAHVAMARPELGARLLAEFLDLPEIAGTAGGASALDPP
jgi:retron-type reverse transcriptase